MSVTFGCPEAASERRRVPCDSPSYGLACTPEERCGYCDDGWMDEWVTECPEVNFANANARAVIDLLGLPCDGGYLCDSIEADEIPAFLQRCMVVLARESERTHLVRDPWEGNGHEPRLVEDENGMARISTGPHVVIGGNTDEQTVRRVTSIRDLLVWAHERGYSVSWG